VVFGMSVALVVAGIVLTAVLLRNQVSTVAISGEKSEAGDEDAA
jgi:hypothetical protein